MRDRNKKLGAPMFQVKLKEDEFYNELMNMKMDSKEFENIHKELEKRYFVYKFINDKGDTIYVGRTIEMTKRMRTHFEKGGHLEEKAYTETEEIYFTMCRSDIEMKILELQLINQIKPKYNKADKTSEPYTRVTSAVKWVKYSKIMTDEVFDVLKLIIPDISTFNNLEGKITHEKHTEVFNFLKDVNEAVDGVALNIANCIDVKKRKETEHCIADARKLMANGEDKDAAKWFSEILLQQYDEEGVIEKAIWDLWRINEMIRCRMGDLENIIERLLKGIGLNVWQRIPEIISVYKR